MLTIQSLAVMGHMIDQDPTVTILIVVPLDLISTWKAETEVPWSRSYSGVSYFTDPCIRRVYDTNCWKPFTTWPDVPQGDLIVQRCPYGLRDHDVGMEGVHASAQVQRSSCRRYLDRTAAASRTLPFDGSRFRTAVR